MTKPSFSLFLLCLLALTACGKDGKDDGKSSLASGATTPDPAPGPALKCENKIAYDKAPTQWLRVNANKFIDGNEGSWELTRVQLHAVHENDGKLRSASASAKVLDRSGITPDFALAVDCYDVPQDESFTVTAEPHFTVARKDGAFTDRLALQFKFLSTETEEAVEIKTAGTSQTFAGNDEAQIREKNGTAKYRIYKIKAEEYELRYEMIFPNEQGGKLTVTVAARFKLKV